MTDLLSRDQIEAVIQNRHASDSVVDKITVEKTDEFFGGMNGVKTAVRVRTNDGCTHRLFLKRTTGSYNGESDIYESLQGLGGPFPTYYGHVDHPTGERTLLVEYLPHCHIWPIPMDFHLAWARCAVRLSHIPVDESLPIPRLDWPSRSDEFIAGIEDALSMKDKTLELAFQEHSLTKLPEQLIGRLPGIIFNIKQLGVVSGRVINHLEAPRTDHPHAEFPLELFAV